MNISQSKIDTLYPRRKTKMDVSLKQIEKQKTITCPACNSKSNLIDKSGSYLWCRARSG